MHVIGTVQAPGVRLRAYIPLLPPRIISSAKTDTHRQGSPRAKTTAPKSLGISLTDALIMLCEIVLQS